MERRISCDVVVIGGGIAGCLAAIRAAELGARTILASKGPVGRSGSSVVAAGTYLYYSPESYIDCFTCELDCTRVALRVVPGTAAVAV